MHCIQHAARLERGGQGLLMTRIACSFFGLLVALCACSAEAPQESASCQRDSDCRQGSQCRGSEASRACQPVGEDIEPATDPDAASFIDAAIPSDAGVTDPVDVPMDAAVQSDARVDDPAEVPMMEPDASHADAMMSPPSGAPIDAAAPPPEDPPPATSDLCPPNFFGTDGHCYVSLQLGTAGSEFAEAVELDSTGNVYVLVDSDGELDGVAPDGAFHTYLIKYDHDFKQTWVRRLGFPSNTFSAALEIDRADLLYVGAIARPTDTTDEIVIATYDVEGQNQRTIRLDSGAADGFGGLAVDEVGSIYIAGGSQGAVEQGVTVQGSDAFLAKYTPAGELAWARQSGTADREEYNGVVLDGLGGIVTRGLQGQASTTLAKFSAEGATSWQAHAEYDLLGGTIASDRAGHTYLGIDTNRDVDNLVPMGGRDMYVYRFDSQGKQEWLRSFGTSMDDLLHAMAADAEHLFIAGSLNVTSISTSTFASPFVSQLDSSGTEVWRRMFGSPTDFVADLVVGRDGAVYVLFRTSTAFEGHTPAGSNDLALIAYDREGNRR